MADREKCILKVICLSIDGVLQVKYPERGVRDRIKGLGFLLVVGK